MKTKYALITGGSRGIGKAIAKQIAKDLGYYILITYVNNDEAAAQTKAEIEAETDASCETLKFDVANRNETQNVLDKLKETGLDKNTIEKYQSKSRFLYNVGNIAPQ